ncbi:hypothetical protein JHK85_054114 [Glycine max]|nr:hypothetical protein JHK85_054114 [Glycine max]
MGAAFKDNLGNRKAACSKRNAKNITSCPNKILNIFLIHEIPKGDYVLEELADSLKKGNNGQSCSASSILRIQDCPKGKKAWRHWHV